VLGDLHGSRTSPDADALADDLHAAIDDLPALPA
jgi:hypothetical protein